MLGNNHPVINTISLISDVFKLKQGMKFIGVPNYNFPELQAKYIDKPR